MAATLTFDQMYMLWADIGDTGTTPVFSQAALQRLYDRAEGDHDTTVVYALRQLRADPRLFFKYTESIKASMTEEEKQGTFDRMGQLLASWEKIAGMEGGQPKSGVIALDLDADDDNQSQWDGSEVL